MEADWLNQWIYGIPIFKCKGVSAQINGAMTSGTAYDQAIDSVSIDLNNGFDFIITELVVGIDSIVIKPSTTRLGYSDEYS